MSGFRHTENGVTGHNGGDGRDLGYFMRASGRTTTGDRRRVSPTSHLPWRAARAASASTWKESGTRRDRARQRRRNVAYAWVFAVYGNLASPGPRTGAHRPRAFAEYRGIKLRKHRPEQPVGLTCSSVGRAADGRSCRRICAPAQKRNEGELTGLGRPLVVAGLNCRSVAGFPLSTEAYSRKVIGPVRRGSCSPTLRKTA